MHRYGQKVVSMDQAIERYISPGCLVHIQWGSAVPKWFFKKLSENEIIKRRVEAAIINSGGADCRVKLWHYSIAGEFDCYNQTKTFLHVCPFTVSGQVRRNLKADEGAVYQPIDLGEVDDLVKAGFLRFDVAVVNVSPPDSNGFCSLGTNVTTTPAAIESAKYVIAQINPQVPHIIGGDSLVPAEKFTCLVPVDDPILYEQRKTPNEIERAIARNVLGLIQYGATMQFGIGGLPTAITECLIEAGEKLDLGIHSEMITSGVQRLVEKGIVTCNKKSIDRGKIVAGFYIGDKEFDRFVLENNNLFELRRIGYVVSPYNIGRQRRMTAVNAAVEVDLYGQVNAESIGNDMFSGAGGQATFMYAARRALDEGRAIIALQSTARAGKVSRIVFNLTPGSRVTTPRNSVTHIVTEYGATPDLRGLTEPQRAQELIYLAYPNFREDLARRAKDHWPNHSFLVNKKAA